MVTIVTINGSQALNPPPAAAAAPWDASAAAPFPFLTGAVTGLALMVAD
jgi:hypothetical protein